MKTLQKITSVLLAVIFLVSSLGFTANKMVCLKSGKTKLSLTHVKSCCPEKKSTLPVVSSQCCDITNTSFNLADLHNTSKSQVSESFAFLPFFIIPGYTFNDPSTSNETPFSFADLLPPLAGRDLLSFISILII
jgi:hypothetical protein